jgi:Flp pilus assembly protein TadG
MSRFIRIRRSDPRSRGQALVEFALVFPIFMLVLFGIIDVGRYVYVSNSLNEASREGARYGSVEQWQYSCPASVGSPDRFTCTIRRSF